jgi:D-alanyl-lipoteichoic acid acyltransferase DltB (MBOAT superfamily)
VNVVSWNFALFTAVALCLYYTIPRRFQNALLLLVSYAYCATWSPQFPLLLLILTAGTWLAAQKLRGGPRLLCGLGLNIGMLVWWRAIAAPSGILIGPNVDASSVVPVVGIAFVTLQAISFVVGAHVGRDQRASFVETALYLTYFPKLTAGPIERSDEFVAMLRRPRVVDDDAVSRAATLVMLGLVRKLVVADVLFELARRMAYRGEALSMVGFTAWALVCLTALYADFAGYTDIARGVSTLFGIELSKNFDRPLLAPDAASFWLRWHMSLTAWLREYAYYPLSRLLLARLPARHVIVLVGPPVLTMIVCGLWHRFSLGSVAWGTLVGLVLALDASLSRSRTQSSERSAGLGRLGALAVVVLSSIPVLLGVTGQRVLIQVCAFDGSSTPDLTAVVLVALVLMLDVSRGGQGLESLIGNSSVRARSGLLAAAILLLALFGSVGSAPFVYQGF